MYILCIGFACQNIRLNFYKFWNHAVIQTLTELCRNNNMEKKREEELSQLNSTTDSEATLFCLLLFYLDSCVKLYFQTTSEHDYSAYNTEGSGTFLISTVTYHLSGKQTKHCPLLYLCSCWTVTHLLESTSKAKS